MDVQSLNKSIKNGLTFLSTQQQPDGSFLSLSSKNLNHFTNPLVYHALFPNTIILRALHEVKQKQAQEMKKKLIQLLMQQKSTHWSFNYWIKNSDESNSLPYPDDLDDTCCALTALMLNKPQLITPQCLAHVVNLLTFTESKEGGPYKTWIVPPTAKLIWQDVDIAVNANIGYFLSLQDVSVPHLNTFIENAIETNTLQSKYYPSIYPLFYFLSPWIQGKTKKIMTDKIKNEINKHLTALEYALCLNSLFILTTNTKNFFPYVEKIIHEQKQDGSWPEAAFCLDPAINRELYYAGSSALTTSLCIEILHRCKKSLTFHKQISAEKSYKQIHTNTVECVENYLFSVFDPSQQKAIGTVITNVLKRDTSKQITTLSHQIYDTFSTHTPIEKSVLLLLEQANLYGWIAYTIYDDFLDQEGDSLLLSIANTCLRQLTNTYHELAFPDVLHFFQQTLANMDAVNMYEMAYWRIDIQQPINKLKLPLQDIYEHITKRSFGHALGPLSLLILMGYKQQHKEFKFLSSFFSHYIIARQLMDDAHDWERDMQRGQLNGVSISLVKNLQYTKYKNVSIQYLIETKILQPFFWNKIIPECLQIIMKNTKQAKKMINQNSFIKNKNLYYHLVDDIENKVRITRQERKNTLEFIQAYTHE